MTGGRAGQASEAAVYCASAYAIGAATAAYRLGSSDGSAADSAGLTDALIACHHPRLGLDRSVCLRDVLEALRNEGLAAELAGGIVSTPDEAADFIERRFTGEADDGS